MELIKFNALLKSTLWGGEKIVPFKHLCTEQDNIGESWEISGVPGNETVVANGAYAGKKLNDVVAILKEKLVGKDNYERFGNKFPLLIKFIDARQDLSIQVHPTDEIAKRQGKERGKTEMWYLLDSDKDATLLCGLKQQITQDASMPSVRVASLPRYSRRQTLLTAFTTSSARIRTATIASCTPSRLPSASTITCRRTIAQSIHLPKTRV